MLEVCIVVNRSLFSCRLSPLQQTKNDAISFTWFSKPHTHFRRNGGCLGGTAERDRETASLLVWCPDPAQNTRTRKRMREGGREGLVNNYASPQAKEFQQPLISSGCSYAQL